MTARIRLAVLALPLLAACSQTSTMRPKQTLRATDPPASASFAQAGDGTVIPDFKPDADSLAFASHWEGRRGRWRWA
jgi:hypothetical protein